MMFQVGEVLVKIREDAPEAHRIEIIVGPYQTSLPIHEVRRLANVLDAAAQAAEVWENNLRSEAAYRERGGR
jgi:hypothetical protein